MDDSDSSALEGLSDQADIPTFFTKGGPTSNSSTSAVSAPVQAPDTFVVETENGSYQFDRRIFRDNIVNLKKYAHLQIKDLDPENADAFKKIVEALRIAYKSATLYDMVVADTLAIFADVLKVIPGTVAAFFIGCSRVKDFPGPVGCNPNCVSAMPHKKSSSRHSCDNLVLIYTNGSFNSLNDVKSSHVYIYIANPEFRGFTATNIQQLRDYEIKTANLIFELGEGSQRTEKNVAIDDLPTDNRPATLKAAPAAKKKSGVGQSGSTNNNAGIIVFVIIILLIIGILLLLSHRRGNF
jgi:hypothetical protein